MMYGHFEKKGVLGIRKNIVSSSDWTSLVGMGGFFCFLLFAMVSLYERVDNRR